MSSPTTPKSDSRRVSQRSFVLGTPHLESKRSMTFLAALARVKIVAIILNRTLNVVARRRSTHRAKRTSELIRRSHPRFVLPLHFLAGSDFDSSGLPAIHQIRNGLCDKFESAFNRVVGVDSTILGMAAKLDTIDSRSSNRNPPRKIYLLPIVNWTDCPTLLQLRVDALPWSLDLRRNVIVESHDFLAEQLRHQQKRCFGCKAISNKNVALRRCFRFMVLLIGLICVQSNATADSCANEGLKSMCEYSKDGAESGEASHRDDALSPLLIQSPPPAPSPFRWRAPMRCGHGGRREAFVTLHPLFTAPALRLLTTFRAAPRSAPSPFGVPPSGGRALHHPSLTFPAEAGTPNSRRKPVKRFRLSCLLTASESARSSPTSTHNFFARVIAV